MSCLAAGSLLIGSGLRDHSLASSREVRVYSGRHYSTDKQIFKQFAEETGIRVRLIEATGISLIERLKREGKKSKADVILLVDAARISNAAKNGLLRSYKSNKNISELVTSTITTPYFCGYSSIIVSISTKCSFNAIILNS